MFAGMLVLQLLFAAFTGGNKQAGAAAGAAAPGTRAAAPRA